MAKKSRDIPITEYFTNLQLEWISYKLRELTYDREIDRKRFHDICEMKKEKIEKFAFRNCCKSIFSSESMKNKYVNKFLGDGFGLPNFQYRDERQREVNGMWDKVHYFKNGVRIENQENEYEIKRNMPKMGKVQVGVGGDSQQFYYEDIKVLGIFDEIFNMIK